MSLKVKFRTLFPALVTAASPLTLVKTGLSYAFGIDIDVLKESLILAPGGSNGQLQYNNAGTLDAVPGATTSATTVLALAPTTSTTNHGLTVDQTLPAGTASVGTSYSGNLVSVISNGYESPEGTTGDATFGLYGVTSAFRVNFQSAGTGVPHFPIMIGGLFATTATSAGQQLVGLNGTVYSNINSTGNDSFWAMIGYANIGPTANINSVYGVDAEVATAPGATIANRIGVASTALGPTTGSSIDAAFAITAQADKYGAPTAFNNAIVLWKSDGVTHPLTNSGSLILTNDTFNMLNGILLPTVTFAGKIFDFGASVFQTDGSGNTLIGGGSLTLGLAGSNVGKTLYKNATSGTLTVQPPTGALGTVTNTLQAVADTFVYRATTDTLTNKTISGASNTLSNIATTALTGTLQAAQEPAHTGDMTNTAGNLATTVVAINGDNQTTAWTTYTPTITAGSGSFTTVSATGRWRRIGKTVVVQADITITTAGTAASTLFASLPLTAAAFNYAGSAIEVTAGKSGAARIAPSGTTMGALDATAATFIANGKEVVMTTTYEIP